MNNIEIKLESIGLNSDNSIVIGSGILSALNIRKSNDIDVLVNTEKFEELKSTNNFQAKKSYGADVLLNDNLEIRKNWNVISKDWDYNKLLNETIIIDEVRYISLDFLKNVKLDWSNQASSRKKDLDDVELIKSYLQKNK
jgi:hypothetical protein